MPDKPSPAEKRTEALKASLVVRTNTAGQPIWYASWRDARGKNVMRTVGPAWLVRTNVFIAHHDAQHRAKPASGSWRTKWVERGDGKREKLAKGALDHGQATIRARELILAREQERDDLHARIARAGDPRSFAALVHKWLDEKRSEVADGTLRPNTLYVYSVILRAPGEAEGRRRAPAARVMRAFGDSKPREITGQEIDDFLKALRDKHKLSERTRQKYSVVLAMIFAFALEEGWIDSNPMLGRKRQKRGTRHRKTITPYSVEQVEAIARQAGGQDGEIVRLASYTGLRQGELLALRWGSVDWTGGMIRVESSWDHRTGTEGPCKSGQSRVVPLGDPAAQVLERLSKRDDKTGPRDLVFIGKRSEHVNGSALYRRYVKARDAVREQDGDCPALVFHDLRHTFGSLLASAGVPIVSIQSYMGHADIATTSIYLHFIPRAAAAAEITRALRRGSVEQVEQTADALL
jgi:integrase